MSATAWSTCGMRLKPFRVLRRMCGFRQCIGQSRRIISSRTTFSTLCLLRIMTERHIERTQSIERQNGRNRAKQIAKGPRTLDIDILLFGTQTLNTPELVVPHPAMKKRQFVLIPLLEVLPDYAEPISKVPYSYFLERLENQGVEKLCTL